MSLGYGGWCFIEAQDDNTVIYRYGSYNWNDKNHINKDMIKDGFITICKKSLVSPVFKEKMKRFPNGKKKIIVKKVLPDIDFDRLYAENKIIIKNCSNCWLTLDDGKDFIAHHLTWKIFGTYSEQGDLPDYISYGK